MERRATDNVRIGILRILSKVVGGARTLSNGTRLNSGCFIAGEVTFGKYCAIGKNVQFIAHNHVMHKPSIQGLFYRRFLNSRLGKESKGPIVIGNDVWVGSNAIILSGVTVGDGAIIGAGSVVTKDVAPYAIVAGNPAKQIKWRFPAEIREFLLDLKWWDWPIRRIKENASFFESDLLGVGLANLKKCIR